MAHVEILLVSAYGGGVQPLSLATAASHLLKAGFQPTCLDVFVAGVDDEGPFADADLVAISMPLFQAVAPGVELAKMARRLNPNVTVVMFGQHANIHVERLLGTSCDYVIRGDWEPALVALARTMAGEEDALALPGLCAPGHIVPPHIHRADHLPPARHLLPPLSCYTYPEFEMFRRGPCDERRVGNVETARGCHHACTYCSVFAATGRKVNIIPPEVVLEDIRQVVGAGASHIFFEDAEFLNAKHHGLRIIRQMKQEFPHLTFDITTRADHILESHDTIRELHELGCEFVTTALEFPAQHVLDAVHKELTVEHIEHAIAYCQSIGLAMNPTFILFNPWVTLEELDWFPEWLHTMGLADTINPIQFETRLYLYKGSPLLHHPDIQRLRLTEQAFQYEWEHPDPRVDQRFAATVKPPEAGVFKRCCIKC